MTCGFIEIEQGEIHALEGIMQNKERIMNVLVVTPLEVEVLSHKVWVFDEGMPGFANTLESFQGFHW